MLNPRTSKEVGEQAAFARFIDRRGTRHLWSSVASRAPPEPDLLCVHVDQGEIAFELVSLTDPSIAKVVAAGLKARQEAFFTADPSEKIILDKLGKEYAAKAKHIELLVYTNGQIITPDDVILSTITPWFDAMSHPFHRIWFMGERATVCVWSAR